jgi:tripartite-type tricarboxylate transporter receptor subunit TctC
MPDRPVRLIVPFPTGGATDLITRAVAQRLSAELGRNVIVENKAGAGGTIGSAEAVRAAPDGCTLLMATGGAHSVAPHLMPRMPYDVGKDFTPIAHVGNAASVVLVTPGLPAQSVAELIDYARRNPGKLNYASSGNGTVVHLTTEAFNTQAGITLTHVPYKGTALSIPDLIAGNVHVLIDSIPSGMPHAKAGRVRALAVTGARRTPLAPELPTVAEAGLPGFESVTWFGLYGPAGMSEESVRPDPCGGRAGAAGARRTSMRWRDKVSTRAPGLPGSVCSDGRRRQPSLGRAGPRPRDHAAVKTLFLDFDGVRASQPAAGGAALPARAAAGAGARACAGRCGRILELALSRRPCASGLDAAARAA